jgi:hypothetical protein
MLRPSFEKPPGSDFGMQRSIDMLGFSSRFAPRESGRKRQCGPRWAVALSALALLGACSNGPVHDAPPLFGTAALHPPPKPGDSISHTQMCECKACDPASCCEGPDDDDAPPKTCGDSYDFSANPGCGGLSVKSCSSRCAREVWRVRVGQDCGARRPDSCCTAG